MSSQFIPYGPSKLHYKRYGTGPKWYSAFMVTGNRQSGLAFLNLTWAGILPDTCRRPVPWRNRTGRERCCSVRRKCCSWCRRSWATPRNQSFYSDTVWVAGWLLKNIWTGAGTQWAGWCSLLPDGLYRNKWQWISTQTKLGNQFFSMRYPRLLFEASPVWRNNSAFLTSESPSLLIIIWTMQIARKSLYKIWTTNRRDFKPHTTR